VRRIKVTPLIRRRRASAGARAARPTKDIGRRWVFIEDDLAEHIRSRYPVKRQALPVKNSNLENADRRAKSISSSRTIDEYNELLGLSPMRRRKGFSKS
jgi:hypothetical protein